MEFGTWRSYLPPPFSTQPRQTSIFFFARMSQGYLARKDWAPELRWIVWIWNFLFLYAVHFFICLFLALQVAQPVLQLVRLRHRQIHQRWQALWPWRWPKPPVYSSFCHPLIPTNFDRSHILSSIMCVFPKFWWKLYWCLKMHRYIWAFENTDGRYWVVHKKENDDKFHFANTEGRKIAKST